MDKKSYQENSRRKYNSFVDKRKDIMLGKILTIVEVLVTNKLQWEKTRKHLLGICNDFVRENQFELEKNYVMEYVDSKEDLIEVTHLNKNGGGDSNG